MNQSKIVIYQAQDGKTSIDVKLEQDTVWLTQAQMAELFQKDQSVIARHIANVFKEGELDKNSNMQILHNTLSKYKPTSIYNLDVIISVILTYEKCRNVINSMKFDSDSELFGNEKDDSFRSSIGAIYQTL